MLSLLSLLIASGTVLRADTELWTPQSYPDPRTNSTQCNTAEQSTLCDPDHLLTDQWRATIDESIKKQVEKLRAIPLRYVDDAPEDCYNDTEPLQIYVMMARRVQSTVNTTVTSSDLTTFGNGLADEFGLNSQSCKNFLLLIVVEHAHEAYVRTGSHLKVPADLMERVFNQSINLFSEKNYMEVLNKIIDEMGQQIMESFTETSTQSSTPESSVDEASEVTTTVAEFAYNETSVTQSVTEESEGHGAEVLLYIAMLFTVVAVLTIILTVSVFRYRYRQMVHANKTETHIPNSSPSPTNELTGSLTRNSLDDKRSECPSTVLNVAIHCNEGFEEEEEEEEEEKETKAPSPNGKVRINVIDLATDSHSKIADSTVSGAEESCSL